MENKEIRIAELKKQILEIEKEVDYNYELVEVTPDYFGGVRDSHKTIAISTNMESLITYCENNYNNTPYLERNTKDDETPRDKWYKIDYTQTLIL